MKIAVSLSVDKGPWEGAWYDAHMLKHSGAIERGVVTAGASGDVVAAMAMSVGEVVLSGKVEANGPGSGTDPDGAAVVVLISALPKASSSQF